MKKEVFQIIEKDSSSDDSTYDIFFKGKLFTETAYYFDGYFMYEGEADTNNEELLDLQMADIPENFRLDFNDLLLHKAFMFASILINKGKVKVSIVLSEYDIEHTIFNPMNLMIEVAPLAKQHQFKSTIHNEGEQLDLERSYKVNPDEKVQQLFDRVKNDFLPLYDEAIDRLLKREGYIRIKK